MSERLRIARTHSGLSARGLDELAGLAKGHTTLLESGRIPNMHTNTLRAINRVLGISLDWLVNGTGPEPTAEQILAAVGRARLAATGRDSFESAKLTTGEFNEP